MNNRSVDKTKKSNIKCEHCAYSDYDDQKGYWCAIHSIPKKYWNRCKEFKWKDENKEK